MERVIFKDYILYDDARIYSLKTKRFLHPSFNEHSQRYKLQLSVYGKKKSFWLHNLVASFFLNNYDQTTDLITFKNNNPGECSVYNLELLKNARVVRQADDDVNHFFENENPYRIVYGYLKKHNINNRTYFLNSSFEFDDLVQYLVTLLHKRTLSFILKHSDQSYLSYAFNLFDFQFKSGDIYKYLETFKSTYEITDTFDYEIDNSYAFISQKEYLNTTYGKENSSKKFILNKSWGKNMFTLMIPDLLFENYDFPPNVYLVYGYLYSLNAMDQTNKLQVTNKQIALFFGVDERSIQNYLTVLKKSDLIETWFYDNKRIIRLNPFPKKKQTVKNIQNDEYEFPDDFPETI